MFSKPVSVSIRLESWKMKPSSSRRNFASSALRRRVMSRPPSVMAPDVTESMVATQFSSVDLPEPDGPMMATNSPLRTDSDTSSSAVVTTPLPP